VPYTPNDLEYLPADADGPALFWFEMDPLMAWVQFGPAATPAAVTGELARAGVLGPLDRPEADGDALVVHFADEWAGFAFLDRLNHHLAA
jgi:hypothetical protein